jgi:Cu+-exporting ATPase
MDKPAADLAGAAAAAGAASGSTARAELPVSGLTCARCVQALEKALAAVPGVKRATVNLASSRAFVEYDPAAAAVPALHEAIKAAGYRSDTAQTRFKIEGMTCGSCVTKIERALRETPGVVSANVSLGAEEALVEYQPALADRAAIEAAAASAGYKVREAPAPSGPDALDREQQARELEYRSLMRKWWFAAPVGVFTMIMSYPWLIPLLRDWFPRGSRELWYVWAFMGVASDG